MAEIIQLDYARILQFRDGLMRTDDGLYTQKDLIDIIRSNVGRSISNKYKASEIHRFILQSFTINGIIETYNSLGRQGWLEMIQQMIDHEVYERYHKRLRTNNQ